jgi:hypothetical protein
VLGRLPEAEIGQQRHRHQQIGEPYTGVGHDRSLVRQARVRRLLVRDGALLGVPDRDDRLIRVG